MRQRKLPDLDDRLKQSEGYLIDDPQRWRGSWRDLFTRRREGGAAEGSDPVRLAAGIESAFAETADAVKREAARRSGAAEREPLWLEIGCGKGTFLNAMAEREPDELFLGLECQQSVIVRAVEKLRRSGWDNLLFVDALVGVPSDQRIPDISSYFAPDELDGIYLHFSDPWPKARHARRRLTHRDYLRSFCGVIRDGGMLVFKTDNKDLFDFTLEEIEAIRSEAAEQAADAAENGRAWIRLEEISRDLHASEFDARERTTEYEEKFRAMGRPIHYLKGIVEKV